jgi:RND family efflux transporter MFP subunit
MSRRHAAVCRRRPSRAAGRRAVPAACLLLAALAVSGCGRAHHDAAVPPPVAAAARRTEPVAAPPAATTVKAEPKPWKATVRSQGGLVADELTVIGARVAGRIAAVTVEVGQRVRTGDVLIRLDDTELRLRIEQAAAELGRARAALGLDPVAETIAGAEVGGGADADADTINVAAAPEVARERARLDEARAQLVRLEALAERNAISRSDLDTQIAAVAVAEATLAAAIQQVEEKVAVLKVHRAQLALTRQTWAQATVRAPFDGLVQSRHGSAPGASVRVGDALVTIVRTDPLRFRGTVPERQALELREGQAVTVQLDGASAPILTSVARIAPVLDEMSRTLLFEADIPNPDGLLRSGLFAQADVVIDAEAQALVVPATSVLEFAGTEKVWLLDPGGQPRGVPVRTGRRSENLVEIVAGLSAGDLVVQHAAAAAGVGQSN